MPRKQKRRRSVAGPHKLYARELYEKQEPDGSASLTLDEIANLVESKFERRYNISTISRWCREGV